MNNRYLLLSVGKALCIGRYVALACEGTYPLLCPRPRANPEGPAEVCGVVPKLMLTFGSSAFKPSCQSRHMNTSLGWQQTTSFFCQFYCNLHWPYFTNIQHTAPHTTPVYTYYTCTLIGFSTIRRTHQQCCKQCKEIQHRYKVSCKRLAHYNYSNILLTAKSLPNS